jgi:hypothetical protein
MVVVHHPIYSAYGGKPGSQHLKSVLENAVKTAGRTPELVLNRHVHNYQRSTESVSAKPLPMIVAGASGYNLRLLGSQKPSTRQNCR